MWQTVHSLFANAFRSRIALPSRVTVVALIVNEQDRYVLASVFGENPVNVRFAESFEEACSVTNQLAAPVVLLDRGWPGIEWRAAVERLSALAHHACVILVSGAADGYLWQELIRYGGYDVLPKPLRADDVARAVKLALSYWASAPKPTAPAGSLRT